MASHTFFEILFSCMVFHAVKCQDFDFTCPSSWKDGEEYTLKCELLRNTYNDKTNGGRCDIYSDSVIFQKTNAEGIKSQPCTVSNFDTTCDATLNSNGCGCQEISGGKIVINYKVTAERATQDSARWECLPQCFDSGGDPVLNPPNTTACFRTNFDIPEDQSEQVEQLETIRDAVSGALGVVGGVLLLVILGSVIYLAVKCHRWVIVFDEMSEDKTKKVIEALRSDSAKQRMQKFNEDPVWCCGRANVKISGHEINEKDTKPLCLFVTGKLLYYFPLKHRAQEVYKWIQEEILKPEETIQFKHGRQPPNLEETRMQLQKTAAGILQMIHGKDTVSINIVCNHNKISVGVQSEDTTKLYETVAEMISAYSRLVLVVEGEVVSCPPDYPGAIPLGCATGAGKRHEDMRVIGFKQEGRPETQKEICAALGQLEKLAKDVPKKIHAEGTVTINVVYTNKDIFVEVKSKNHTELYKAVAEMILPFSDLELCPPDNSGAAACGDASGP